MDAKKKNILMGGAVVVTLLFAVGMRTDLPQKVTALFAKEEVVAAPAKRGPASPAGGAAATGTSMPGQASAPADASVARGDAVAEEADSVYPEDDIQARIERAAAASSRMLTDLHRAVDEVEANEARAKLAAELARQGKSIDEPKIDSVFKGKWYGTYTGFDTGRLSLSVSQDGTVTGNGISEKTGGTFEVRGAVTEEGALRLTKTVGGAADQVPMKGEVAGDAGAGSWSGGTWRLQRQ